MLHPALLWKHLIKHMLDTCAPNQTRQVLSTILPFSDDTLSKFNSNHAVQQVIRKATNLLNMYLSDEPAFQEP